MKLASLRTGGRDGTLIVVSRDLSRAVAVPDIAPTLQSALDDWANLSPRLATVAEALEAGIFTADLATQGHAVSTHTATTAVLERQQGCQVLALRD